MPDNLIFSLDNLSTDDTLQAAVGLPWDPHVMTAMLLVTFAVFVIGLVLTVPEENA